MEKIDASFVLRSDQIVLKDSIEKGFLLISEGSVKGFQHSYNGNLKVLNYDDSIILPGFVDIHVHGWGRGSFAYKGDLESLDFMSQDLPKAGVTSFLATSGTMPNDFLEFSLQEAAKYIDSDLNQRGAEVIGIHMEGPYISAEYLGMQRADSLQLPSIEGFDHFNHLANKHIRLMTLAPELEGAIDLIRYLKLLNITSSAGHTAATFDQITDAVNAGLNHFTHAYCGMKGFHHRELGVVGALMYHQDCYAEVAKQTGITIKPEAFDILYRLKRDRRMVLMSDCMGYANFPEGYSFYHYLREQHFTVKEGNLIIEKENEPTITIDTDDYEQVKDLEMSFLESVGNIVDRLDHQWLSIAKISSENPAKLAGVFERKGSLCTGKDADIIIVNKDKQLIHTICRGVFQ